MLVFQGGGGGYFADLYKYIYKKCEINEKLVLNTINVMAMKLKDKVTYPNLVETCANIVVT
jgi:aspartokinase-like uncharacterized kinase